MDTVVFIQVISVIFFLLEIFYNKDIKIREMWIEREAGGKYLKILGGLRGTDYMQYSPFSTFCQWGCLNFYSEKSVKNIFYWLNYLLKIKQWDKNIWTFNSQFLNFILIKENGLANCELKVFISKRNARLSLRTLHPDLWVGNWLHLFMSRFLDHSVPQFPHL